MKRLFAPLLGRRQQGGNAAGDSSARLDSRHSATFSLTVDAPRPSEQPPVDPETLPVAKLIADEGRTLCRIREITAGGMVCDVTADVTIGTPLRIELDSDRTATGVAIWQRGQSLGIRFEADVDVADLVPRHKARRGRCVRPPRLEIECAAVVQVDRDSYRVEVRDISQGGVKVALPDPALLGKRVSVNVEDLRTVAGTIRWYEDGRAGILFDKPLSFDELAAWLSRRVEFACLKAGAKDRAPR